MKQDLLQSRLSYLKYLRVSAKFIDPCQCPRRKVHTYCQTAQIIMNQRIYCDRCGSHFNLFIKEETLCNSKLIQRLIQYFFLILLLVSVNTGFLILDGFMKTRHAAQHPEQAQELEAKMQ